MRTHPELGSQQLAGLGTPHLKAAGKSFHLSAKVEQKGIKRVKAVNQ